jgi:hypothetical protein
MVTHFEPYTEDEEEKPIPFCGTITTEKTKTNNNWSYVDCKKCLKLKNEAKKIMEQNESFIINQMQGFVDFQNKIKDIIT